MNVLFITADQLRGDSLGFAGHPLVRTPNLDKLARLGVTFLQHFATCAPCAPARASMHTGMYMANHRVINNGTPLDAGLTNWAQELRQQAGMRPAVVGYVDQVPDPRELELDDPKLKRYDGGYLPGAVNLSEPSAESAPEEVLGTAEWLVKHGIAENLGPELDSIRAPGFVSWNGFQGDMNWLEVPKGAWARADAPALSSGHPAPAAYPKELSDTAVMTQQAEDFISKQAIEQQPWALHVSYLKPHAPLLAPEPFNMMYHPSQIELPMARANTAAEEAELHPFLAAAFSQDTQRPLVTGCTGPLDIDEDELKLMICSYYALISEVDENIGKLLDHLAALGQDSNTLVIFTSDHGELLGEHWLRGKMGFHDGAYHIPLVIRDPRATSSQASIVHAFTEHIDIAPTILDCMNLSVPRQFEGRSLRPFLYNPKSAPPRWRTAAHFEFDYRFHREGALLMQDHHLEPEQCAMTILRTSTRKLVLFGGGLPPLFFDLCTDPFELCDVSGRPEYTADLVQCLQDTFAWRARHNCTQLTHLCFPQMLQSAP